MARWSVHWAIHRSGESVVEADSWEQAEERFRTMTMTEVLGDDKNIAYVSCTVSAEKQEG